MVPSNGATICRRARCTLAASSSFSADLHFQRGDLLVVVGLLGFEPRLVDVEPFDVELRLRHALGEAGDRLGGALQLGFGDFGRLAGEADLHVVGRLLVGDVVLQLGGQLGHLRDLIVDLGEQRALLHRVAFAHRHLREHARFLRRHIGFGEQTQHDRLHFERLRI